MIKSKFVLTQDLIKVQSEPEMELIHLDLPKSKKNSKLISTERLSLNIDADLKKKLNLFCVHNKKNMTSVIEAAVKQYLNSSQNDV